MTWYDSALIKTGKKGLFDQLRYYALVPHNEDVRQPWAAWVPDCCEAQARCPASSN
jgi:hypothetical protein